MSEETVIVELTIRPSTRAKPVAEALDSRGSRDSIFTARVKDASFHVCRERNVSSKSVDATGPTPLLADVDARAVTAGAVIDLLDRLPRAVMNRVLASYGVTADAGDPPPRGRLPDKQGLNRRGGSRSQRRSKSNAGGDNVAKRERPPKPLKKQRDLDEQQLLADRRTAANALRAICNTNNINKELVLTPLNEVDPEGPEDALPEGLRGVGITPMIVRHVHALRDAKAAVANFRRSRKATNNDDNVVVVVQAGDGDGVGEQSPADATSTA